MRRFNMRGYVKTLAMLLLALAMGLPTIFAGRGLLNGGGSGNCNGVKLRLQGEQITSLDGGSLTVRITGIPSCSECPLGPDSTGTLVFPLAGTLNVEGCCAASGNRQCTGAARHRFTAPTASITSTSFAADFSIDSSSKGKGNGLYTTSIGSLCTGFNDAAGCITTDVTAQEVVDAYDFPNCGEGHIKLVTAAHITATHVGGNSATFRLTDVTGSTCTFGELSQGLQVSIP